MTRRTRSLFLLAAAALAGAAAWLAARGRAPAPPTFAGAARCGACHAAEHAAWRSSQHAVAMQAARPGTVLGRFDGGQFTDGRVTSTFLRRGGGYVVRTEGVDGRLHDFPVAYTFGVWPLQQYLVPLPGGRFQASTLAWDARPAGDGGQRWFTLEPTSPRPTDAFHWTGPAYNWNYMCADCHSTGVRKRYDAGADGYRTTVAELVVECESCHGPGAAHARWAGYPRWLRRLAGVDADLPARLTERRGVRWIADPATGAIVRSAPRPTDREIEVCAQCHARRVHIADGYVAGARLLDHYIPELIERAIYFPDGQQREEVFTYGSFLQSRMYAAGVTCADCHDPHTQKLRRPGNQVCAQCHRAERYDTVAHHFHAAGSLGAQCVGCHLPATTYMRVDPRHDHSLRIPRPDLSVRLGVPNACNRCHADRDARWAAAQVKAWYRTPRPGFQRFAGAFAAADRDDPGAADSLRAVAGDATEPAIVRASAITRLEEHGGADAPTAGAWTRDGSPLVRLAALQAAERLPAEQRLAVAVPLLGDETRAVRQGAAWILAPMAARLTDETARRAFARAAAEFEESQRYNADREPNRLALGAFHAQLGQWDSAMVDFTTAVRLAPRSVQAHVALAEALRALGRVAGAVRELESAAALAPGDSTIAARLRTLRAGAAR